MKTTKEIIEQCKFVIANLTSGCVECNEKAMYFYKSIIKHLEILEILKGCTDTDFDMWDDTYYINGTEVSEEECLRVKRWLNEDSKRNV